MAGPYPGFFKDRDGCSALCERDGLVLQFYKEAPMSYGRFFLIHAFVWLALFHVSAFAQPGGCSDEKSHQFDFWIGEWEVTSQGQLAGTNSIRPILDGCVLQETWSGSSGSKGTSLNFFNPSSGKWHQLWVWKNGTTLPPLSGGYHQGKMVLEGQAPNQKGVLTWHRISWHDNDDGTVRQHWETSVDDGKSWSTLFDGLYRKK